MIDAPLLHSPYKNETQWNKVTGDEQVQQELDVVSERVEEVPHLALDSQQEDTKSARVVKAQSQQVQEPVHIVYASDDASIPGVVQSIKSVLHYAQGPVTFHFVGDSPLPLSPSEANVKFYNMTKVKKQFKLSDFTNPRKRAEKDRKTLNASHANYVRFVMDELLLPDKISRAMWIDADTIVKCDIVGMIQNAFQKTNHAVAAVTVKGRPQGLARRIKKKYSHIKKSFNAGVFVVDLDRWREQGLTEKIRKITLSNSKRKLYKYGSQPPLTMVIGNDFEHLNSAWNVKVPLMNRYFKDNGNDAQVCLLHWVGGSKPWEGHGLFREWWKDIGKEVNRETMVKIADKNRAEKVRKWKAKVAVKRAKREMSKLDNVQGTNTVAEQE